MRKPLAFVIVLSIPLLLAAAAWQAGRYATLAAEARRLEALQEDWVSENEKLEAGIAVLSSRERAAGLAKALRLEKAGPERRLFIGIGKDRSDG
jgi:hypothetical protein